MCPHDCCSGKTCLEVISKAELGASSLRHRSVISVPLLARWFSCSTRENDTCLNLVILVILTVSFKSQKPRRTVMSNVTSSVV